MAYKPFAVFLPRLHMPIDMHQMGMLRPQQSIDCRVARCEQPYPNTLISDKTFFSKNIDQWKKGVLESSPKPPNAVIKKWWQDNAKCRRAKQATSLSGSVEIHSTKLCSLVEISISSKPDTHWSSVQPPQQQVFCIRPYKTAICGSLYSFVALLKSFQPCSYWSSFLGHRRVIH